MMGENIKIINSEIGITSKDLSEIDLSDVKINDTNVGFAAFQKKPEFGPASILISDLEANNVKVHYLIEKGSTMITNGKIINNIDEKVEEILYGVKYGKSSK